MFEPTEKLVVCTVGHSSGDGDLPLLFEGKVLESLMETLIVGILLCLFFRVIVVALLAFIIFVIELP